jgi:hypothetical protein
MNVHWEISLPLEVNSALMLALGAILLYDAFMHAMTADAGQVLIGSVSLAFCFLAVFFLVWERR